MGDFHGFIDIVKLTTAECASGSGPAWMGPPEVSISQELGNGNKSALFSWLSPDHISHSNALGGLVVAGPLGNNKKPSDEYTSLGLLQICRARDAHTVAKKEKENAKKEGEF